DAPVRYVAGFCLDERGRVVLIVKTRPAWQAGLLNAPGGKVEGGETPAEAMRREMREEAGLDLDWEELCTLAGPGYRLHVLRALVDAPTVDAAATMTDERVVVHRVADVLAGHYRAVGNVP